MRIVNSIEREIVQVEWENWLLKENTRCRQLGSVIYQNSTDPLAVHTGNGQKSLGADPSHLAKVRAWHREYCESCSKGLGLAGIR